MNKGTKKPCMHRAFSFFGIALGWFSRIDEKKHDWSASVSASNKQGVSKKTAFYTQVEAQALTKKETENVSHYALKFKQLVGKGWCNESAGNNNIKCSEIFTPEFLKKLKKISHTRLANHTTNFMEPTSPFHTLGKLVDAQVITDEKIVLLIYHWN